MCVCVFVCVCVSCVPRTALQEYEEAKRVAKDRANDVKRVPPPLHSCVCVSPGFGDE